MGHNILSAHRNRGSFSNDFSDIFRVVWKESRVALVCGAMLAAVACAWRAGVANAPKATAERRVRAARVGRGIRFPGCVEQRVRHNDAPQATSKASPG